MKEIDLTKSVYELTEEFPELIEVLKELGFVGLANPLLRRTLGRKTTLPDGCKKQGKDLSEVINFLKKKGFSVRT